MHNDPLIYGRDLRCIDDADDQFSEVTGLGLIKQSAYHRLTNDRILGEPGDPDCEEYGFDCVRLSGMTSAQLLTMPAVLSAVLQRDERIQTADVTLTTITNGDGTLDVVVTADCTTALGPFKVVFPVSQLTAASLGPTS